MVIFFFGICVSDCCFFWCVGWIVCYDWCLFVVSVCVVGYGCEWVIDGWCCYGLLVVYDGWYDVGVGVVGWLVFVFWIWIVVCCLVG